MKKDRTKRLHDELGSFAFKGTDYRRVRSVRLTDAAYESLKKLANEQDCTVSDLIEDFAHHHVLHGDDEDNREEVISKLQATLKMPPNRGGAIKKVIREVLSILRNS